MAKKVNILGALLIGFTFFIESFALVGYGAGFILIAFAWILIPVFIGINIAAYFTVRKEKVVSGVLLSVLGGSIGGAIAVEYTDNDFSARKVIETVFQIKMWLLAWLVTGFLLYLFGYYELSLAIPG